MSNFFSLKVPKVLSDRAQPILEREGYRSFSEFVLDSARRRLDQIKEQNTRTQNGSTKP